MKSPSISNRINIGFAATTTLIVVGAVLAFVAVSALGDSYKRYRLTAKQNIVITAFVEDLFEARVASLKYRANPNDNTLNEVTSKISERLFAMLHPRRSSQMTRKPPARSARFPIWPRLTGQIFWRCPPGCLTPDAMLLI